MDTRYSLPAMSVREHRLCALSGPEMTSASETVEKRDKAEAQLENPKEILAAARHNVDRATKDLGRETQRLAQEYFQQRTRLEEATKEGLKPESIRAIQTQMRTLHTELAARGVTLAQLGVNDPAGESQRQAHDAGQFLQTHIHIEYTPGMQRNGNVVRNAYGCIPLVRDAHDHEYLDVFLGPKLESPTVFIMEQAPQYLSGTPRQGSVHVADPEQKCLIGFQTEDEARQAYLQNYPPGWKAGPIRMVPSTQFSAMLRQGRVA